MTSPGLELRKAIYAALYGDAQLAGLLAGERIYDHVPPAAPFPYITFGRSTALDWSTSSEDGTEHIVSLHVWSQARGGRQTQEIMARIGEILDSFEPALAGHRLVLFRRDQEETRFDVDAFLHHGIMRFRALIEMDAA